MSHPDAGKRAGDEPSSDSIQAFIDALIRLTDDPTWLLAALTETLAAMRPPGSPTEAEVEYLLSSGSFSPTEMVAIGRQVARGSLALDGAESFLSAIRATWSLEQVTGYLHMSADAVNSAVIEGKLYAVEVAQHLRFPVFQFNVGRPEPLIPHLPTLIDGVRDRWGWISTSAFMETPQDGLLAVARQTPRAWLIDGGDPDRIMNFIRLRD